MIKTLVDCWPSKTFVNTIKIDAKNETPQRCMEVSAANYRKPLHFNLNKWWENLSTSTNHPLEESDIEYFTDWRHLKLILLQCKRSFKNEFTNVLMNNWKYSEEVWNSWYTECFTIKTIIMLDILWMLQSTLGANGSWIVDKCVKVDTLLNQSSIFRLVKQLNVITKLFYLRKMNLIQLWNFVGSYNYLVQNKVSSIFNGKFLL